MNNKEKTQLARERRELAEAIYGKKNLDTVLDRFVKTVKGQERGLFQTDSHLHYYENTRLDQWDVCASNNKQAIQRYHDRDFDYSTPEKASETKSFIRRFGAGRLSQSKIIRHLLTDDKHYYVWYNNRCEVLRFPLRRGKSMSFDGQEAICCLLKWDIDCHSGETIEDAEVTAGLLLEGLVPESYYLEPSTNGRGMHLYILCSFEVGTSPASISSQIHNFEKLVGLATREWPAPCAEIKGKPFVWESRELESDVLVSMGDWAKVPHPTSQLDMSRLVKCLSKPTCFRELVDRFVDYYKEDISKDDSLPSSAPVSLSGDEYDVVMRRSVAVVDWFSAESSFSSWSFSHPLLSSFSCDSLSSAKFFKGLNTLACARKKGASTDSPSVNAVPSPHHSVLAVLAPHQDQTPSIDYAILLQNIVRGKPAIRSTEGGFGSSTGKYENIEEMRGEANTLARVNAFHRIHMREFYRQNGRVPTEDECWEAYKGNGLDIGNSDERLFGEGYSYWVASFDSSKALPKSTKPSIIGYQKLAEKIINERLEKNGKLADYSHDRAMRRRKMAYRGCASSSVYKCYELDTDKLSRILSVILYLTLPARERTTSIGKGNINTNLTKAYKVPKLNGSQYKALMRWLRRNKIIKLTGYECKGKTREYQLLVDPADYE